MAFMWNGLRILTVAPLDVGKPPKLVLPCLSYAKDTDHSMFPSAPSEDKAPNLEDVLR